MSDTAHHIRRPDAAPPVGTPGVLAACKHLLALVLKHHRRLVLLQIALTALLAVLPSVHVVLTRYLFDGIVTALAGSSLLPVAFLLAIQGLLALGATIIGEWKQKQLSWLEEHITLDLKERLFTKMQRLELTQFEQTLYHEGFVRAQTALPRGVQLTGTGLLLLESCITVVSYAVVASRVHWSLPILLPVFALPSLFLGSALARRTVAINRGMTPTSRAANYLENLLTSRHATKEIRIYQFYEYILKRFRGFYWSAAAEHQRMQAEQVRTSARRTLTEQAMNAAVTLIILSLAVRRRFSLGVYVAITQAMSGIQTAIETFAQKLVELYGSALQMADYFAFLELPEAPGSTVDAGNDPLGTTQIQTIDVQGLSFAYPGRDEPSLSDVSFGLRRGEIVAIVGENGSGKTTLAKCLLGLYTPQSGSVRYNGVDIRSFPHSRLYQRISALFQDFVQYELTVRDNIILGDVSRMQDDQAIREAAHAAQLDEIIQRLPDGLDAELGAVFGTGKQLSMGQWQRLALARVFFKNAEIIMLDEPTASLDPVSELRLFNLVKEVYRKDRFLVLISHRLGVCREVDRILVLQDGKLVESGNHAALMARNGVYARLYQMQASMYVEESAPAAAPVMRDRVPSVVRGG